MINAETEYERGRCMTPAPYVLGQDYYRTNTKDGYAVYVMGDELSMAYWDGVEAGA